MGNDLATPRCTFQPSREKERAARTQGDAQASDRGESGYPNFRVESGTNSLVESNPGLVLQLWVYNFFFQVDFLLSVVTRLAISSIRSRPACTPSTRQERRSGGEAAEMAGGRARTTIDEQSGRPRKRFKTTRPGRRPESGLDGGGARNPAGLNLNRNDPGQEDDEIGFACC